MAVESTVHRLGKERSLTLGRNYAGASLSIHHWQLRDLVTCGRDGSCVYYIKDRSVEGLWRHTGQTWKVDEINFSPVSMTSGHGYVACGGNEGELYLGELGGNPLEKVHNAFKVSIEGKINNSLEMYKSASDIRILIANNDNSVKSFSIATQSVICSVDVPKPVNYSSMSVDGNSVLAVGDTNQGWMFDVRAPHEFVKTGNFGVSWDAGFSCAWNRHGDRIAVAAQEGYCRVWDVRALKRPLGEFRCHQYPEEIGACRNVKFSKGYDADLLVFAEQHNYVHVVDMRNLEEQCFRVSRGDDDVTGRYNIGGISLDPQLRNLFVGTKDGGLFEYKINLSDYRKIEEGEINMV